MSCSKPPSAIFRKVKQFIDLKEQIVTNYNQKEEQLLKVVGGNEHTICLFNNGEMLADGWNEYGHYGINPLEPEYNECKITKMKKVNVKENRILQNCKVVDVFTKFNFTIYLAIHNETNEQILLASGWNYGGCCSCNIPNDKHVLEISQCYFLQSVNYEEIMVNTLQNERIIEVACGGCHLCILTEDIITKEQFIYECGKNSIGQLSEGKDIPILKKSYKIMDFIKCNDNYQLRIKQIIGSSSGKSFLTCSGKLFTIGIQTFSNEKNLRLLPQSLFDNELVKEVSDCQGVTLVLTNLENIFVFKSRVKGKPIKYYFKKKILNIATTKNVGLVLFEDFSLFITELNYAGTDAEKNLNLVEYLFEGNIEKYKKEYQLLNYYLENKSKYDFYFCGDNKLNFVVLNKAAPNVLAQKLQNILLAQNSNNDKNYFYDFTFKF